MVLHATTAFYLVVSPEMVTDAGKVFVEWWGVLPPLVVLSPPVLHQAMLSFKPLCTFYAIPLTQPRQVLGWFGSFALCKLFGGAKIRVYLVEISGYPHESEIAKGMGCATSWEDQFWSGGVECAAEDQGKEDGLQDPQYG
ncbi:hypothetical protein MMC29_002524 [Sticta canariensis]|nr:hypothetical protein [Sticta canariensis]